MTPEEAQAIFEGCLVLVLTCGWIGYGIGLVLKLLKSGADK